MGNQTRILWQVKMPTFTIKLISVDDVVTEVHPHMDGVIGRKLSSVSREIRYGRNAGVIEMIGMERTS